MNRFLAGLAGAPRDYFDGTLRGNWKFNGKLRALVLFRGYDDVTVVRLHNLIDDCQAETGATNESGLQRFKYLAAMIGVHAHAGITKTDADEGAIHVQTHGEGAAFGHGTQCVVAEIPENLFD